MTFPCLKQTFQSKGEKPFLYLTDCSSKKLGEIIRGQRLDDQLISKEELEAIRYRVNRKKTLKQRNPSNSSPGGSGPTHWIKSENTELVDVGRQRNNGNGNPLQQPDNRLQQQPPAALQQSEVANNGLSIRNGFSMNDYIRLNILKNYNTNVLNRMGVPY